jgi:hypothetical protein
VTLVRRIAVVRDSGALGEVPEWIFVERSPKAKQRDPIQGEFFNTDSITTTADEVIREAVQNTLDAKAGAGAVRVRLFVSGEDGALVPSDAARYFEKFWAHAEECGASHGLKDEPCRFIVVEDFGTTGLTGNEAAYEEPATGDDNNFFYFFRAEGKSGKSGADRGRWGIGKYVFPKASLVNSFFALTVRVGGSGIPGPLVMGQAVMKNHKVDRKNWEPDGWWAVVNTDDVPVPASDQAVISAFHDTWKIERTTQPGLTVVVPYVDAELSSGQLVRSVVRDYFVAILFKTLTVDIASTGSVSHHISYDTLDAVIEALPKESERVDVRRNADLVRWSSNLPDAEVVTLQAPSASPAWRPELISNEARNKIRSALDEGKSVVVRVPVNIVRNPNSAANTSSFDVLLQSEQKYNGKPLFVREGIIVSEVRSRTTPGVRGIVLVRQGAIANLLGDAEGPAHTNWSDKTDRFKGSYRYGPYWLSFIRQAPSRLLDLVRGTDDDEDRSLGAQFFSVPADTEEQGKTNKSDKPGDTSKPKPGPSSASMPRIRISKRKSGGFTVRLTDAGMNLTRVDVTAAYDRSRGNPFTKWQPEDFDLNDLDVEVFGGDLIEKAGNHLAALIVDPAEFTLRVDGFDINRDVRIRTRGRTAL